MKKTKKKLTINDLPKNTNLGNVWFKHPETGEKCLWYSQWHKGIWYKKDATSGQIFPLQMENIKDALKFEVVKAPKKMIYDGTRTRGKIR